MKKTLLALGFFLVFFWLILPSGCYWDNEEDLYGADPTPTCDTSGIRFSVEIKQILEDHCYECHRTTSATYSQIPYETYNQFKVVVLNGELLKRINNAGAPMPQTGLMSICNRQKIEAWVRAGAPDN